MEDIAIPEDDEESDVAERGRFGVNGAGLVGFNGVDVGAIFAMSNLKLDTRTYPRTVTT